MTETEKIERFIAAPKYWVCRTSSKKRASNRNYGYEDKLGVKYSYDSNVGNARGLKVNDGIVIVNKAEILGFGVINQINEEPGEKLIIRCPECNYSQLEIRKTKTPKYRCKYGHVFDTPVEELGPVTNFEASYDQHFFSPSEPLNKDILQGYYSQGYNKNNAIQALSADFIDNVLQKESKLEDLFIKDEPSWDYNTSSSVPDYELPEEDLRKKVKREVVYREGQAQFRKDLLDHYGKECMISHCTIEPLLEAAHIIPYRSSHHNDLGNGLILRVDLHRLFDKFLLGIHPEDGQILISEEARTGDYEPYHKTRLLIRSGISGPSQYYLEKRWKQFLAWNPAFQKGE